jgi:hypothetical protein
MKMSRPILILAHVAAVALIGAAIASAVNLVDLPEETRSTLMFSAGWLLGLGALYSYVTRSPA